MGLRCDCCWIHLNTLHYSVIVPGLVCTVFYSETKDSLWFLRILYENGEHQEGKQVSFLEQNPAKYEL